MNRKNTIPPNTRKGPKGILFLTFPENIKFIKIQNRAKTELKNNVAIIPCHPIKIPNIAINLISPPPIACFFKIKDDMIDIHQNNNKPAKKPSMVFNKIKSGLMN